MPSAIPTLDPPAPVELVSVGGFLRADPETLHQWVVRRPSRLLWFCFLAVVVGAAMYGGTMGCWREARQSLYTSIKLPLVILLTTLGNGLLNGMLAPLLGINLSFRQSLTMVLFSFAIASFILGALSPVALFIVWNTPALTAATRAASAEYGFMQLTLVFFIALAGVMGNASLLPLLHRWSGNAASARNLLFAWLVGNLFLGSQVCWVLRPFIGNPDSPVEFIVPDGFSGSFFETVFEAAQRLLF